MKSFPLLHRRWSMLPLLAFAAACGGDDPSGPEPVASVEITAPVTSLTVGATTQLTAIPRDADGDPLSGRTVTWNSSSSGVATVSASGLVTAVTPGTATITATSEGRSGTVQITVVAANAPTIADITPATLRPGETGTITGTNFSTSASSNVVLVGGERAIVTAATATSITFTLPSGLCVPTGPAPVIVEVGTTSSAPANHPVQNDAPTLSLPVGELTILESPADFCLRFASAAANEGFAFGVQSITSTAATLTPVRISSRTAGTAASPAQRMSLQPPMGISSELVRELMMSPTARRWADHRRAEARIREADRQLMPFLRGATTAMRGTPGAVAAARAAASIPSNVQVGDTVDVRVPNLDNICSQFAAIRAVVRVVGQRGVWIEDVGNPANGFTLADFQALSARFDNQIYATNVEWFGQPTDRDANSRIVIVATKEVNRQGDDDDPPPLGFVTSGDLVERTLCQSSDFGEIYYGRAPDPAGEFGPAYQANVARQDAVQLIGHEFTHIIQFGRRLDNPQATSFQTRWELEGQATLAEEVNGHVATNRTSGQNYGFEVAWTGLLDGAIPSDIAYYADGFFDLLIYFGLNFDGTAFFKTTNAPEQCSWLGTALEGNVGPCLRGREVYGVPWSFLRWITDQFAATIPGGGPAIQRALIDSNTAGFANVANVTGTPINQLLAEWSATLWTDDRFAGMEQRLTFPSWDLVDAIDEGLIDPAHLTPRSRTFSSFSDEVSVRGGSTAYFTIGGGPRPATFIGFRRPDGAQLPANVQIWVVRTR